MEWLNERWKEGRYIDLWSVNHILSGVVLAALLFNFSVGFWPAFIFATILFVGWEVYEVLVGIKEHTSNMVMDVVCDLAGFLYVAFAYFVQGEPFTWMGTALVFVDFMAMNLWGYLAYQERKRYEESTPVENVWRLQSLP